MHGIVKVDLHHCILLFADEDDLRDVRLAVTDVAAKWKDLGISLGIRLSELNVILSANPHSPSDCLREMLSLWLKQNHNVRPYYIKLVNCQLLLATLTIPQTKANHTPIGKW